MSAFILPRGNQPVFGEVDVEFEWYGDRLERDVSEAAVDAMEELLELAAEASQFWAPVDTGALQASIEAIGVDVNDEFITGYFGSNDPNVDYALHQELGTIRFPGNFYLTRGAEETVDEFTGLLEDAIAARGWSACPPTSSPP